MFIKPRPYSPASFSRSTAGYLPRWVWWPYNLARFFYEFSLELLHAREAGISPLMIPLAAYLGYKTVSELDTKSLFVLGLMGASAVFGVLASRESKKLSRWREAKWKSEMKQYHTDED